jgi:hypothetical protein
MTVPESNTKRVWRVKGMLPRGTDTQPPSVISPINAAEYAIVLDFSRFPNIVNHNKNGG